MITVTVSKKNNSYVSFTSKGHAGYAEEVNSLEQLTGDQIQAEESDGFVSFSFVKPVTKEGTLLMDSLVLGLTEIENSYSKRYLKVKVREV